MCIRGRLVIVIKKFCPYLGCKEVIDINKQYCDKHQPLYEAKKAESIRQRNIKYDKTVRLVRDKQYHDFYLSNEWEQLKVFINRKYKGLCLYSYLIDKQIVQADIIHHIVEIKEDWELRLSIANLIPLSNRVHNRIHLMYKDNREEAQAFLRRLLNQWKAEIG
jgi:5-methylcytosine-specific restriction endonuclease McrA